MTEQKSDVSANSV